MYLVHLEFERERRDYGITFLQDMEEKRLEKNNAATDICSLEHSISLISRKLVWCARGYVCKCVCERDMKQLIAFKKD